MIFFKFVDVYQKVWMPVAQENEPMRVIYRMRGLLGDATEEFIETLRNHPVHADRNYSQL